MSFPTEISASPSHRFKEARWAAWPEACRRLAWWALDNFHLVLTAILAAVLLPALHWLGLPLRFNWTGLIKAYWVNLTLQSIFAALLLSLVSDGQLLRPWWKRHQQQKARLGILFVLFLVECLFLGASTALFLSVVMVTIVEFLERERGIARQKALDVAIPAAYLFLGFFVMFGYNDVIAAIRFYGAYDAFFNRIDSGILFGTTVSEIAHAALRVLPSWAYQVLEFFYYGMFAQVGAGLLISALCLGRKTALRFAGTILVAYYLALALFFLWPSQGPFYLCARHFSEFPQRLQTYAYQKIFLENVQQLWEHRAISRISTDYYIAFPCMHIAQPLIVAWFLRHRKRMLAILLSYDVIMVAAILLLEWHYAVDLIGGVVVAAVAVLTVNNLPRRQQQGCGELSLDNAVSISGESESSA